MSCHPSQTMRRRWSRQLIALVSVCSLLPLSLPRQATLAAAATTTSGPFVQDTFTGPAGTLLENHTADSGASWVRATGSADSLALSAAGRLRAIDYRGLYYSSASPTGDEYDVTADLVAISTDQSYLAGLVARFDPATGASYRAVYDAGYKVWQLSRVNADGTTTNLATSGSSGSYPMTNGASYHLKLSVSNAAKQLWVQGPTDATYVKVLHSSDNVLTAAGRVGLTLNHGGETSGLHLDNFAAALATTSGSETGTPATAAPTSGANSTSKALTVGPMHLSATFNSIGLEVLFRGDANANAQARLQFKKTADTSWREGLPLWPTNDGSSQPGPAFYGSVLMLDPGTSYDVRVSVSDPDGVSGAPVLDGTISTRAEDIAPVSSLTPSYFVAVGGSDTNDGHSPQTAWATLARAFQAAPAGAVVQVGPGRFAAPPNGTVRTQPLSLVAQDPAVDDNRNIVNAGRHTIVDSGVLATPSGSGQPNAGVWQPVAPDPGHPSYVVWKWSNSGLNGATQLGFASTLAAAPARVASWKADSSQLATPAGWVDMLYRNLTWNSGFYTDPAHPQDVYVRLPGDANPNQFYVTLGGNREGLDVDGPNIRVSGLELREFDYGVSLLQHSSFDVVDHNLLVSNFIGVRLYGERPGTYGHDQVVQYNRFIDSNLWTADHTNAPAIPWDFIKGYVKQADGTFYTASAKVGGAAETAAVLSTGGSLRSVIRFNSVDGLHDGISQYSDRYDRYSGQDLDVTGNLIQHLQDDAIEPGENQINMRIWNNRSEYTGTCMSTNPVTYGPVYYVRNMCWRVGIDGLQRDQQGWTQPDGIGFKYSGESTPTARIYLLNNTIWTDSTLASVMGGGAYGGGDSNNEDFYLRNNIFAMTSYGFGWPKGHWNEDYDYFYSTDASHTMQWYGGPNETTLRQYQSDSGQGAHSQVGDTSGGFRTPPQLTDPSHGDLTLAGGSPQANAGTTVANIADLPGVNYLGAAPDMGAAEAH